MDSRDDGVAAALLVELGQTSGLSQAELARRSGFDRSVLNAYVHGRRQPSVAALARIASAAGQRLELRVTGHEAAAEHAGGVLSQVLDLAGSMPYRPRTELEYPPLIRLRS
jgi:transcriptional regulator with XRE-family HTH domain